MKKEVCRFQLNGEDIDLLAWGKLEVPEEG